MGSATRVRKLKRVEGGGTISDGIYWAKKCPNRQKTQAVQRTAQRGPYFQEGVRRFQRAVSHGTSFLGKRTVYYMAWESAVDRKNISKISLNSWSLA